MKTLIIAARPGRLSLAQTNLVVSKLLKLRPDVDFKLLQIKTEGDRDTKTSLWHLKTTGFFTSGIEQAVLEGQADLAVHSFKDLPTKQTEGLQISAVCCRDFVEDCLVCRENISSIDKLKTAAKVGTSSLRRAVSLKRLRRDLQILPIRGNITTRIEKLKAGQFDAIVLARAGIERLGLAHIISFVFNPKEFIPAPAQGALAVQTRSSDKFTTDLVSAIDDHSAHITTAAERRILIKTRCGCHAPLGAFAKINNKRISINAFISDLQGDNFLQMAIDRPVNAYLKAADELAGELLKNGGSEILKKMKA